MTRVDPGPVLLEPMTWDEFDVWSRHSVQGFAAQQVRAGLMPAPDAGTAAQRLFDRLLPSGLLTPLHHLWTVRATAAPRASSGVLGHLWLQLLAEQAAAFVLDVEVVEHARGSGLGRATMLAAERAARDLGARVVRLSVFGHNTPALRLYEGLGYRTTDRSVGKRLAGQSPPGEAPGAEVVLSAMTDREHAERRERPPWDDPHRVLVAGPATPGHLLSMARAGEAVVGAAWVELREHSDGLQAVAHRVESVPGGPGLAAVVAAVERDCRTRGVGRLLVPSVGEEPGAGEAYRRCGFDLTAQTMAKQL